ncbi:MAG: hypothetical protein HQL76_15335 [Magnetococcales bacterium]|nr:hypothetical protein [Magnetococcales bacterium]
MPSEVVFAQEALESVSQEESPVTEEPDAGIDNVEEEADILEDSQLGSVEEQRRQAYFAELERQRHAREQAFLQARQQEAVRVRNRRRIFLVGGGLAAGIVFLSAAYFLSDQEDSQATVNGMPTTAVADRVSTPSVLPSEVGPDVVKSTAALPRVEPVKMEDKPEQSALATKDTSGTAAPVVIDTNPIPLSTPVTVSSTAISEPSSSKPLPIQDLSTSPETAQTIGLSQFREERVAPLSSANRPMEGSNKDDDNRPGAVAEAPSVSPPAEARDSLAPFVKYHTVMDRLSDSPYETITPPKGEKRGVLTYRRHQDGDIVFSLVGMMLHTASRRGDTFRITSETIPELRLVFQVIPKEAFMFEFDVNGVVKVPRAFWDSFSPISKRAVSVSRVISAGSKGISVRDLCAVSITSIKKMVDRKK